MATLDDTTLGNALTDAPMGIPMGELDPPVSEQLEAHVRFIESGGVDGAPADFSGVDLRGVDLRAANLEGADLRGAKLTDAKLSGAVLRDCNMGPLVIDSNRRLVTQIAGADLAQAVLDSAKLSGARLEGAKIETASIKGAEMDSPASE